MRQSESLLQEIRIKKLIVGSSVRCNSSRALTPSRITFTSLMANVRGSACDRQGFPLPHCPRWGRSPQLGYLIVLQLVPVSQAWVLRLRIMSRSADKQVRKDRTVASRLGISAGRWRLEMAQGRCGRGRKLSIYIMFQKLTHTTRPDSASGLTSAP